MKKGLRLASGAGFPHPHCEEADLMKKGLRLVSSPYSASLFVRKPT